jgi:hypothetical protein
VNVAKMTLIKTLNPIVIIIIIIIIITIISGNNNNNYYYYNRVWGLGLIINNSRNKEEMKITLFGLHTTYKSVQKLD